MQGRTTRLRGVDRPGQRGIGEEAALFDRFVEPGDPLIDDEARAEVEVADLRVAHLPGRQPDVAPGSGHLGAREAGVPLCDIGRMSEAHSVTGVRFVDTEAIEDDQCNDSASIDPHCSLSPVD